MRNRKIGVLMGGLSSEKNVSISSGRAILGALIERGYDATGIFVDRDLDLVLRQKEIDIAFLALHGRYGEDGCIQGMLELMGIPYTGSDVLAAALSMNKAKSKELFRLHNLPTPTYYLLNERELDEVVGKHGDLGFPVVVKPIAEGSSVGVQLVRDINELPPACELALQYDSQVLVEQWIRGQEISVAVVEDRALGAIEIETGNAPYDFAAKYDSKSSQYFIPPRVSPQRYRGILGQAEMAHRALGCSGATRVDMILSPTGNEYVLEVNSLPGLTPNSLLPKIAHAAGLAFEDLVEAILGGARLSTVDRGDRDRRLRHRAYNGDERRDGEAVATH
ncbi:MAG: D-alanine--D-alanine ligase [Myxococcales bacterium]|nr:D-alanine--D-alanine ligase [Myxococcales bacterium]